MIAVVYHSGTCNVPTHATKNDTLLADADPWPVKVADRIALFERQTSLQASSIYKVQKHHHQLILNGDATTVHSFLESIGQDLPQTLPPKLWRLACERKKKIEEQVDRRKYDASYYFLSEELNQLDSILYSDTVRLEMEALDLLACSRTCHGMNDAACIDYCDDDIVEDEDQSYDASIHLLALESGVDELTRELERFK